MITSREDPADRGMFHDPATVTQGYPGTWRIPAENVTTSREDPADRWMFHDPATVTQGYPADRRLPSGIPSGGRR